MAEPEAEAVAERMADRPLRGVMDPGWAEALEPVAGQIREMGNFLRAELAAGRRYLPAGENVLRAFKQPFAGSGRPRSSVYSRKMLTRLGGSRCTSGATEKLSPTAWPGVG